MSEWAFLTNHARVLQCIADDHDVRIRDIADCVGITERAAHAIVTDLCSDGYVSKERDGARNHYEVDLDRPLRGALGDGIRVRDLLESVSRGG